jgi:predicted small lipoprotein YifL
VETDLRMTGCTTRRACTALLCCALAALALFGLAGCASSGPIALLAPPTPAMSPKINFDTSEINSEGVQGPPGGQVSVSYEFCIPGTPQAMAEVQRIDPTAQCTKGSRGRIGCTPTQALCIGDTHQADWAKVLNDLAALPYIERIDRSYFE